MANTTLKVITKLVDIKGERFVLVKITRTDDGNEFYGTISYNELDEKGCMKRELNGIEMCLNDTIGRALALREEEINTRGMNKEELIKYYQTKFARA